MIKIAQIMAFVNYKGGVSTTTTRMGYHLIIPYYSYLIDL